VLEWDAEDDKVVIRRVGVHSSEDVHHALFPRAPEARTLEELRDGPHVTPESDMRAVDTNVLVRRCRRAAPGSP
jgi:hypothetical protein